MDEIAEPKDNGTPVLGAITTSRMEPLSILSCNVPTIRAESKSYWIAHNFASRLHNEFLYHKEKNNPEAMQQRFYLLAKYYGRTLAILRQALRNANIPLINTALRNIVILHQPLYSMREVAPTTVPLVLTLSRNTRERYIEDLIIRVLRESNTSLSLDAIVEQIHDLHVIWQTEKETIQVKLKTLIERGYVKKIVEKFSVEPRAYTFLNMDHANLEALLGPRLYTDFTDNGFRGLTDIVNRRKAFASFFSRFTGCGEEMAELFILAATEIIRPSSYGRRSPWVHFDLIGSQYPRPYQRDAFTIFRGYGYKGVLIEAPTGSGKTLMGLMCIQDWFNTLTRGESVLVLVPTTNYIQQWVAELCYKEIGLQMPLDEIFAGTPSSYEADRKRTNASPPILIMTYTSLAQMGSPKGKGGFDKVSIEKFIQAANIQFVILDEVHKVADNLNSVSANVTRLFTEWLQDGSLRGLIGFSGTAAAYRDRFPLLGLKLVYIMPPADLIAYGFVAPFAELGIPFSYSDREEQVLDLLEQYKKQIKTYISLVGVPYLVDIFKAIPMEERIQRGLLLDMYEGHREQRVAVKKKLSEWEKLNEITLNELNMISIIQLSHRFSDRALIKSSMGKRDEDEQKIVEKSFTEILVTLRLIRAELKKLIFFQDLAIRLDQKDFGELLDTSKFLIENLPKIRVRENLQDCLSGTIIGLYTNLKNFYYRIGEGRLDTINAIIEAEYLTRDVTGVIVFDNAKRLKWKEERAVSGYAGVAGVFSQMLGDPRFVPLAVLSNEIYMPWKESDTLPSKISDFIKREILTIELGYSLFDILVHGIDIPLETLNILRPEYERIIRDYVKTLRNVGASRPGEFTRRVLNRFRELIRRSDLGKSSTKIFTRLNLENNIVRRWVEIFYDYAIISRYFDEPIRASLCQANGRVQHYFVVKMPDDEKKLLMYNLMARVFDAENLPINVIIVSSWARTGWNVIKPNVLIDATATRDVTAWQQLRGRAMRARRSWDKRAYELMTLLLGTQARGLDSGTESLPQDIYAFEDVDELKYIDKITESQAQILKEVYDWHTGLENNFENEQFLEKIREGKLSVFSKDEREHLATKLMLCKNKVTHIFELVKAYGSTKQIIFDRATRKWVRSEAIALKHQHEYSVDPFTGIYQAGESHAPLLYADDPRDNLPSNLHALIVDKLKHRDPLIVKGWIDALITVQDTNAVNE